MIGEIDRFVGTFDVSAVRQIYHVTSPDSHVMSHDSRVMSPDSRVMSHHWHVLKLNVGKLTKKKQT